MVWFRYLYYSLKIVQSRPIPSEICLPIEKLFYCTLVYIKGQLISLLNYWNFLNIFFFK